MTIIKPILCGGEFIETDLIVFVNSEQSSCDAYIGVALLERLSIDPQDLLQRMLVGRLRNACAKLCKLRDALGHDNRTINKWAEALKSGDIDVMVQAFAGRGYRKKTTPELIRYAQQFYNGRTALNLGRNYRETIGTMIEGVFAVKVCPSLLSEIFRAARQANEVPESHKEEGADPATCG